WATRARCEVFSVPSPPVLRGRGEQEMGGGIRYGRGGTAPAGSGARRPTGPRARRTTAADRLRRSGPDPQPPPAAADRVPLPVLRRRGPARPPCGGEKPPTVRPQPPSPPTAGPVPGGAAPP